ncbi:unnamed protein product [Notodromas monacha]|uniref:WAP domain-containing protein n=1 Tax=Notodromas monacha TaxID=399045 RepID=A0A7R9GH90_9CRUS|nr:unnamed protein product [Notodromas monacha]CAG0920669.1 unnamed protein product [Notodromas monacha]
MDVNNIKPGRKRCSSNNEAVTSICGCGDFRRTGTSCFTIRGRQKRVERPIAAKPAPVCPVDNTISACVVTPEDCFSDAECKQGQLCCPRGCSRRCTAPTFRQPDPRSRCTRGSCPRGTSCVIYETNCNRGITGLRLCPLATICVPDFRDQCQVIRCTSETQCRYRPNPSCARPSRSCPPIADFHAFSCQVIDEFGMMKAVVDVCARRNE